MKIRNGFVSNSSSSSFIIALEKKPETKEDVLEIFTPYKYRVSDEALNRLLVDLNNSYPMDEKSLLTSFNTGYMDDYDIGYQEMIEMGRKAYKEEMGKRRNTALDDFKKDNPNAKFFYELTYSDNDGDFGSYMEHDLPWESSSKVRVISNH